MKDPQIVIVEFESQMTPLIECRLREIGFRSAVLSPTKAENWIKLKRPKAIIFSGSRHSVNNPGYPDILPWVFDVRIPILGICYGMQLITKKWGGEVISNPDERDYGPTSVHLESSELFRKIPRDMEVCASHGDTVSRTPGGFTVIATSGNKGIAAIENRTFRIYGVQFHPESLDTKYGPQILANFVEGIAGCERDWQPADIISHIRSQVTDSIGNGCGLVAFSGGVDSTTLSAIIGKASGTGPKIKAVCVNGGQFRHQEIDEVRRNAKTAGVSLQVVFAGKEFSRAWDIVRHKDPDPELKRKVFRATYTRVLSSVAKNQRDEGSKMTHFIQGTLAPDMIESGMTSGACIKTHHNIGVTLGKSIQSLHPFSHLFKYEVRALAEIIGLPSYIVNRHPFPGPGLFIRLVDQWPTPKKLAILSWADYQVSTIIREVEIYNKISQIPVGLSSNLFAGVKGCERARGHAVFIRPFRTVDFMTGEGYEIPFETRRVISTVLTKHPNITAVSWWETSKPPQTIEFE